LPFLIFRLRLYNFLYYIPFCKNCKGLRGKFRQKATQKFIYRLFYARGFVLTYRKGENMTVYIEYVLIDNFVIDWLILKAALTTAGLPAAKSRLFFSALVGAAVALVYPAIEVHAAILVLLKISAGFFMDTV